MDDKVTFPPNSEGTELDQEALKAKLDELEADLLASGVFRAVTRAREAQEKGIITPPWEPRNGRYWFNIMEERMRKEIALAQLYASDYNHGTAGHNRLILLDAMAKMLDAYEERLAQAPPDPIGEPFKLRRVLPVRYNPQWGYDANAMKKDCGPAGLETLCEFHEAGMDRTTDEIMRYITGGVDRATSIGELQRAASDLYGLTLKRYNGATVYDLIKWIDAGHPAMVLIWYGGYELRLDRGFTGGHYWVVVGYEQFKFEGKTWTRFIIHDPDYYGARHVVSGAFMPVSMAQFSYVWDNAHKAWDNPDNVALTVEL